MRLWREGHVPKLAWDAFIEKAFRSLRHCDLESMRTSAITASVLPELAYWEDAFVRDGYENMAVDDWLAETFEQPVLRSYRWLPEWGSCGYFIRHAELPREPANWVRRWTGGGIVDHRRDRTYTLFIPRGFDLAEARGAESYRTIHAAVAQVLAESGVAARLSASTTSAAGGECFVRPVEYDVMDAMGSKLAGAGQRRSVRGLLHQGSVLSPVDFDCLKLGKFLAVNVKRIEPEPPSQWITERVEKIYRRRDWLQRR